MVATRKVNELTSVGDIQDGDILVGERTSGTTVRITYAAPTGVSDGDKGDITVSSSGTVWTIDTPSSTTVATDDKVLIKDTSNSDATRYVTAQSIANLAGVTDGDKGDITVSGSGAVWTIDNGAVTLAKMADIATSSLIYRRTAGTGVPEVNTLATLKTDLGLTGTNSGDQTITLTGDVTGSGTGSFAATISNDAVSYAKIQNVSATDKLLGRSTAGAGDVEEITCTAAGRALLDDLDASAQRTTLGLGTLATQNGTFSGTSSGTNTGDQNLFQTIAVSGQSDVVADSTTDTLTLAAGSNITITTDATTDTITIAATGGSPGGSDTQVQFNDGGSTFGGDAGLTYNKTTDVLSVSAGVSIGGNSTAAGYIELKEDSDNGSNKITLTAPASVASDKTITLPDTTGTVALTANKLSDFAATTSAELAGVISDETGSGALVFATSPTLVTPVLGTPTSGTLTNCTGYPELWTLITSSTASSSSSIDFTGLSSTYKWYKIVFRGLYAATDATSIYFRISTDNGSTWKSGASDYAYVAVVSGTSAMVPSVTNTAAQISIDHSGIETSNVSTERRSGEILLMNHASGSVRFQCQWYCGGFNSTSNYVQAQGNGTYLSTTAVDGFRILMSSGNIAAGEFNLYGIK